MTGMRKPVQQIALNFGEDPEAVSPAVKDSNGTGDQPERQFMATAGVVVRVKSYKSPRQAMPANAELFQGGILPPAETTQPAAVSGPEDDPRIEETAPAAAAMPEVAEVPETVASPRKGRGRTRGGKKAAAPKAAPAKRGRKSLKQISAEADLIEIPADDVLFLKQYYTMGEVSEMCRVNFALLRFW